MQVDFLEPLNIATNKQALTFFLSAVRNLWSVVCNKWEREIKRDEGVFICCGG